MTDYISREAAIKAYTDLLKRPGDIFITDITDALLSIPAADVRPVVMGKWEEVKRINTGMLDERIIWKCSNCGCEIITTLPLVACDIKAWHYCPNCGADMREES